MALFKTDQANAAYPQCLLLFGSFKPVTSAAWNQQIIPANQTLTVQGTAAAQVSNSVNPTGLKVNVFAGPNTSQPIPAANIARMPAGQASGGAAVQGAEFLIDLGAFPADIVSVDANIVAQTRFASLSQVVAIEYIDTVNKLVYLGVYSASGGFMSYPSPGSILNFQIALKDSIGV